MTEKQRNLRSGWSALAISLASFINLFTHNHFTAITLPLAFVAFTYVLVTNLKR